MQLEWWNHPALFNCLAHLPEIPQRLIVWCHVSGLNTPIIPEQLLLLAHRFVFTSSCSYQAESVLNQYTEISHKLGVISSCGGFEHLPKPSSHSILIEQSLSVGYMGSLNFAKLHPQYVEYLAKVPLNDFRVTLIGDMTNHQRLQTQCKQYGKPELLHFYGYTSEVVKALNTVNVFAYLLNPKHYGTTENALIEAMAMGIVPIVMNNPAEQCIVVDQETGFIVNSSEEFIAAMVYLSEHPARRVEMAHVAADCVRTKYTPQRLKDSFEQYYCDLMCAEKTEISFYEMLGEQPADWFLTCQQDKSIFAEDGQIILAEDTFDYGLFDPNKGTVMHFQRYFPEDNKLSHWAENLASIQ